MLQRSLYEKEIVQSWMAGPNKISDLREARRLGRRLCEGGVGARAGDPMHSVGGYHGGGMGAQVGDRQEMPKINGG